MREWSITRSTGSRGLMISGSFPMAATASRIEARSATAAPPVRSWSSTLAGIQGMSPPSLPAGLQLAAVTTSSSVTISPSLRRSMFSTIILME